jgi:uncharacterized protein (DUF4415 family)
MNKEPFTKPSLEQALAHLKNLRDDDIDVSDAPEWTAEMLTRAELRMPSARKSQIALRVDGDVINWFRENGKGYQTRMNAVLRAYVEAQKTKSAA